MDNKISHCQSKYKAIYHCYVYIINMIYYFVRENIFAVEKDKDNITSAVQIGYQK